MTEQAFQEALRQAVDVAPPPGPEPHDVLTATRAAHRRHRHRQTAVVAGGALLASGVIGAVVVVASGSPARLTQQPAGPGIPTLTVPVAGTRGQQTDALAADALSALAPGWLAQHLRTSDFQAFTEPAGSMSPLLLAGDHVLLDDALPTNRGDVIVFAQTGTRFPSEAEAGNPGTVTQFAKRVIAVAGDTVACPPLARHPTECAQALLNGRPLDESSYLGAPAANQPAFASVRVPTGSVFVLGDNRADSFDSRSAGPIPTTSVTGVVIAIDSPHDRVRAFSSPN